MIHVLTVITAKPGMRARILEACRANVEAVRAEAGCLAHEAVVDVQEALQASRSSAQTPLSSSNNGHRCKPCAPTRWHRT